MPTPKPVDPDFLKAHNERMKNRPPEPEQEAVEVVDEPIEEGPKIRQQKETKPTTSPEIQLADSIRSLLNDSITSTPSLILLGLINDGKFSKGQIHKAFISEVRKRLRTEDVSTNTEAIIELLNKLKEPKLEYKDRLQLMLDYYKNDTKPKWNVYSGNELHKATKPPVLIETDIKDNDGELIRTPVLYKGRICILSSQGGAGKSTLATQLCLAGAYGNETQHEFTKTAGMKVAKAKTLILSYEDEAWQFHEKLQNMLKSDMFTRYNDSLPPNKQPCDVLDNFQLLEVESGALWEINERGYDQSTNQAQETWDYFWQQVDEFNADLVIVDPLFSAYQADTNSVTPTRRFIAAMQEEARNKKCGVILISHATKGFRAGKDATGGIAGSAAISDSVRSAVIMEPVYKEGTKGNKREDEEPDYKRIYSYKSNYGKGFDYMLEKQYIDKENNEWAGFKFYKPKKIQSDTDAFGTKEDVKKSMKYDGNGNLAEGK